MLNYLSPDLQLEGGWATICERITQSVLACFTFLSGFFLKKYEFRNLCDVKSFYIKRLTRFYPLFVVAAFSTIICGNGLRSILLGVIGLSLIVPPAMITLWYFSMLILFYILTPLLKIQEKNTKKLIAFVVCVCVVMLLGYTNADERLAIYFPFYVIGLNFNNRLVENSKNWLSLLVSLLLWVALCEFKLDGIIWQIIHACCGVSVIVSFSYLFYCEKLKNPIGFVASASMCAYLFHRPLYTVIVYLINMLSVCKYMTIPIAGISLALLIVLSFYIQKLYENALQAVKFGT
jgi:peptidoglycan/LPS O-acetylase OafA/YrhL